MSPPEPRFHPARLRSCTYRWFRQLFRPRYQRHPRQQQQPVLQQAQLVPRCMRLAPMLFLQTPPTAMRCHRCPLLMPQSRASLPFASPDSTTIHTATIPIARVENANSSWSQQLQLRLPSNIGLIPSINRAITPLLKVDYHILISIPIPQRNNCGNSLVSRLTSGSRKRSPLDLAVFNASSSSPSTEALLQGSTHQPQHSEHSLGGLTWTPTPTAIQLGPIPIVIGTIPSNTCHKKFKWPIPNYLGVSDRPTFVRDRFEEEMMQHLSSLESLMMEDDDDIDIDSMSWGFDEEYTYEPGTKHAASFSASVALGNGRRWFEDASASRYIGTFAEQARKQGVWSIVMP
ncbi:hypothetical protein BC939DRAFT_476506 [Gamsiella multidivaricata]|uniref:uncharacterized protein n=1 Tax=Gamsiella multidivaricata TaxID=101098 RepID=UPI0022209DC1|nr:uncharacterized protein BC939DRAFT_476506 [Gamsiella multidivaricata]KAI7824799.1 hypothetical protein BC939DRAFT_476506 [Gamsiella multidivaricata]